MKAKLEARKQAVIEENDKMEEEFKKLSDQSADLDRKRQAIKNRVQGNVRVINEIDALLDIPAEPVSKPSDKVPVPLVVDRKAKKSSKVIKPGQFVSPVEK